MLPNYINKRKNNIKVEISATALRKNYNGDLC